MDLIKNIYSESFYKKFGIVLKQTVPNFDEKKFKSLIFDENFEGYELKQRLSHTTKVLNHFLPRDFKTAAMMIKQIIKNLIKNNFIENNHAIF